MSLIEKIKTLFTGSQFFYSLILIILIPTLLAANTIFIIRAIDRDINAEILSKASLVGDIVAPAIQSDISEPANLDKKLNQIIKNSSNQIVNISVLLPNINGDGFSILTSTDKENSKKDGTLITNQLVWADEKTYASKTLSPDQRKLWTVIAPVKNSEDKKVGLINVKVSTEVSEKIVSRTIRDSLMIMIGTIVLVLLLLLNHIRFFETSVSFNRLKEVNKLKDVFISVASHELLSPMTAIKGYLELLKESDLPSTTEVRDNVNFLSDNFDRLQELVMDLLDVSRIENNKVIMNLKPVNLEEMIKQTLTQFAIMAKQKNLDLSYQLLLGLPKVNADERRLRQVITNLVSNAIKYTNQGGLTITHEVEGKTLITHFRDTGIGIPETERANLFQKFYRVRSKDTENIPGTGLGLWLIKQFVEKMNGKIYLESIEHTGTQITLVLPVVS